MGLRGIAACIALCAAGQASASILYQMVGGVCLGTEVDSYLPPRPCSHTTVKVWMRDDYVPGTAFGQGNRSFEEGRATSWIMERIYIHDGGWTLDFSPEPINYQDGDGVFGFFPEHSGPGEIRMTILSGLSFRGGAEWIFYGSDSTPHYKSWGYSEGWERMAEPSSVPEPASLALALLALGVVGVRRLTWLRAA